MNINELELAKELKLISNANPSKCMKCGKCSASCPSYDEMEYHPHQFVSSLLNGEISKLANSESIWNCMSCMLCMERCPRSVAPVKIIEAVRDSVIRKQGCNFIHPEDIPEVLNDDLPQQAITCAFRRHSK